MINTLYPARPSDVPDLPLRALMNVQQQRAEQAREYAGNRDETALCALAVLTVVLRGLLGSKWALVDLALQGGASGVQVAAALDVEHAELQTTYAAACARRVARRALDPELSARLQALAARTAADQ